MAVIPGGARSRSGGGITVLVLNRAAIAGFNFPGGMTYRWVREKARLIQLRAAVKLGPGHGLRTGELLRSLGSSATPTGGGVVGNVRATARHAYWYHEGNGPGKIYPRHPQIRDANGRIRSGGLTFTSRGRRWNLASVNSYEGHPFIAEAMEEVLYRDL
jgi:hypothetical protein